MNIARNTLIIIPFFLIGCTSTSVDIARLKSASERVQDTADNALTQSEFAKKTSNQALKANIEDAKSDLDTIETRTMTTREIALRALEEARMAKLEYEKATQRAERMLDKALSR